MADERWQGKVDEKLKGISSQLGGINEWMRDHEEQDSERFTNIEKLIDHDKDQRSQIAKLTEAIVGNGKDGLNVKVDRNTRNIGLYNKLTWLLLGAVLVGSVSAVLAFL